MASLLMWLAGAVVAVVITTYLHMLRVALDGIPGPRPWPVVGNLVTALLHYATRLHALHEAVHQQFGDVARTWGFTFNFVHLRHPDDVRLVLAGGTMEAFDRSTWESDITEPLLGGGLITRANGPAWKRARRLAAPSFRHTQIAGLLPHVARKGAALAKFLCHQCAARDMPDATVDMQDAFQCVTFDVIGVAAFGHDFQTMPLGKQQQQRQQGLRYARAWEAVLKHLQHRLLFATMPYFKFFSTRGTRRFEAELKLLSDLVSQCIRRKDKLTCSQLEEEKNVLCTMLLGLRQERAQAQGGDTSTAAANKPLTPDEEASLRAELLTFLFAGHDTTTNLLVWACYYLAKHHSIAEKVRHEVDAVGDLTLLDADQLWERVRGLDITSRVLLETLRLRPSAPTRGRTLVADAKLRSGHVLRRGQTITFAPYSVHRHPEFWPHANRFDPDRFLPAATHARHPFAYVPFGAGPRRCIGQGMALAEAKVLLATLVQRVNFRPPMDKALCPAVEEEMALTLRARYGLWYHVEPRTVDGKEACRTES